jgi:YVTN family beta-propeller protein
MSNALADSVSGQWKRPTAITLFIVATLLAVASLTFYGMTLLQPSVATVSLQTVMDISLPDGGTPSYDQQALDPTTGHLFLAHPGGGDIVVFDSRANKVIGRMLSIPKNHGIAVLPSLKRLYVSETLDNQVYVVNEQTSQIVAKIPVGSAPDMIASDDVDHELFVSNQDSKSDSVIDTRTNRVIATIQLGGEAGNTRYDATLHRVFVAVQTLNQVVAIDPRSHAILSRLTLPAACQHDHGLILDETLHLGFAACDGSSTAVMLDVQQMKVLSSVQSVGNTPDLLTFDKGRHLLYVASHSGVLTIFSDQHATFQRVYMQCIATNAHSVIVDPTTHQIYMPLVVLSHTDTCPAPAPKTLASKTAPAKAAGPTGPRVLRIFLFHDGAL